MCLPDFIGFKDIPESEALTGYRGWRIMILDPSNLISETQDYVWKSKLTSHKVTDRDSGIYSYNNYNNYNYNNIYYNIYNKYNNIYKNYNYNNNIYNNYNYNNYGIILQWGRVAIHKMGYRSEFAKIQILFTIRESDAVGPQEFHDWIKKFNRIVKKLALKYNCGTMYYQDFIKS